MQITAKDLRRRTGEILKRVSRGNKVIITLRGKPAAVLSPIKSKKSKRPFEDVGFGIWAGRNDLENVEKWIDQKRSLRGKA